MKLPNYVENVLNFLAEKDEKYFGTPRAQAYERMKNELIDESLTAKNPQPISEEKVAASGKEEIIRKLDDILRVKEHLTPEDINVLKEIREDAEKKNPRDKVLDMHQNDLIKIIQMAPAKVACSRKKMIDHLVKLKRNDFVAILEAASDEDYDELLVDHSSCANWGLPNPIEEQENPTNPTVSELKTVFRPAFDKSYLGQAISQEEKDKVWREIELFIMKMVKEMLENVMNLKLKREKYRTGALEFKKSSLLTEKELAAERSDVERRRYYKLLLTAYLMSLVQRFFYIGKYDVVSLLGSLEEKKTWKQLARIGNREANARSIDAGMRALMKDARPLDLRNWINGNKKLIEGIYAKSKSKATEKEEKMGEAGKKKLEEYRAKKKKIVAKRPEELRASGGSKPKAKEKSLEIEDFSETKVEAAEESGSVAGKISPKTSALIDMDALREALARQGITDKDEANKALEKFVKGLKK